MTERLTNAQNKAGLRVPQDISWGVSWERLTAFGLSRVHAHSQEMCRAVVSSTHLWQELIYHRQVKTRLLRIRVSFPSDCSVQSISGRAWLAGAVLGQVPTPFLLP